MQRGILKTNIKELQELIKQFNLDEYKDTPLFVKMTAALNSKEFETQLEISANEAEVMLDSIVLPMPDDSNEVRTLRRKLQDLLMEFRNTLR